MALQTKEQIMEYTAFCKQCNKDISKGTIQEAVFKTAAQHFIQKKHEVVFGNLVKWVDDSKGDDEQLEHIAYCKNCKKNIAQDFDIDSVLVAAMQHCTKEKHDLVFGILLTKNDT